MDFQGHASPCEGLVRKPGGWRDGGALPRVVSRCDPPAGRRGPGPHGAEPDRGLTGPACGSSSIRGLRSRSERFSLDTRSPPPTSLDGPVSYTHLTLPTSDLV